MVDWSAPDRYVWGSFETQSRSWINMLLLCTSRVCATLYHGVIRDTPELSVTVTGGVGKAGESGKGEGAGSPGYNEPRFWQVLELQVLHVLTSMGGSRKNVTKEVERIGSRWRNHMRAASCSPLR